MLQEYLQIIYIISGMLVTGLGFLIPLIKCTKAKKGAQLALEIAQQVQPYIIEAEKFINYSGDEKLAYVVTKANQYAISNNIKFDVIAVTENIEKLVDLTKKVNVREKDKQIEQRTKEQVKDEVIIT